MFDVHSINSVNSAMNKMKKDIRNINIIIIQNCNVKIIE
jgi:hypothetical protein